MEEFSPLDRFLLFASVGGMFASLAFYAAARTAKYWKAPFVRFARASRTFQAIFLAGLLAVTALGGGKTNDALRLPPRIVRTIPAEDLPAWFVALGYPATDADASGIPDCWEKWTHTRGFAPDADPDGDGLTNLEEFEAQTDPIRADTDGDGIDDASELAGLAAGIADLDPVTPATFVADEPDTDQNGVPDLWEEADILFFDGVDPDGFPWGAAVPEPTATNYDVRLSVSTSRHAALSWGSGSGESILLPPCTNLALRLRLPADDVKTIALLPSPNASTNPFGTWRGAVVADWDERRGLPTEDDRVAVTSGTMVDRSEHESVSVEAWMPPAPLRSGGTRRGGRGNGPEITFTPRRLGLVPDGLFCLEHGPAPTVWLVASNAPPPYVWTECGVDTLSDLPSYSPTRAFGDGHYEVSARWRDDHSTLVVSDTIRFDPIRCRPGQTNFVGAGWTSTHNPTNAADHAPGITETDVFFGPLCPVAHDVNLIRGYKHSPTPDIRNLDRIVTGDPQDDETDHCVGILWTTNLVVRLEDLLDPSAIMEFDQLSFSVQTSAEATITSNTIEKIRKPDDLWPAVFHVELHSSDTPRVLDRCWIVVNSPQTKTLFVDWYSRHSSNTNWTLSLPAPPSSLILDSSGNASLPAEATQSWHSPTRISDGAFIHHAAIFEIRSYAVAGGYGHQATYDEEGHLIKSTISAGTADYRSPTGALMFGRKEDHRVEDMLPFVRALQLDGNPILVANRLSILRENLPLNLNRPCLRQGTYTDKYIQLRPTLPTGTLP